MKIVVLGVLGSLLVLQAATSPMGRLHGSSEEDSPEAMTEKFQLRAKTDQDSKQAPERLVDKNNEEADEQPESPRRNTEEEERIIRDDVIYNLSARRRNITKKLFKADDYF